MPNEDFKIFKPKTSNDYHNYAVGLMAGEGTFCPIETYGTLQDLEAGLRSFYAMAKRSNITIPIPVERVHPNETWKNCTCRILKGLLEKVVAESEKAPDN